MVEYRRAGEAESVHRGAFVLLHEKAAFARRGQIDHPYFLRSAAKPFQALALLLSGGEKEFGLTAEEIALITASHGGEDLHERVAASILKKGGLSEADLQCGSHEPFEKETAARLRSQGKRAGPLRHNCSGKHAGMLLLAKILGCPTRDYLEVQGAVQQEILKTVSRFCEIPPQQIVTGVDGCSATTFAMPLTHLARGFWNLGCTENLAETERRACKKIVESVFTHPMVFGGRKQLDSDLLQAAQGEMFAKRGAEGVLAAVFPGKKTALALKIDDGSSRNLAFLMSMLIQKNRLLDEKRQARFASLGDPVLRNAAGRPVGEIVGVLS